MIYIIGRTNRGGRRVWRANAVQFRMQIKCRKGWFYCCASYSPGFCHIVGAFDKSLAADCLEDSSGSHSLESCIVIPGRNAPKFFAKLRSADGWMLPLPPPSQATVAIAGDWMEHQRFLSFSPGGFD